MARPLPLWKRSASRKAPSLSLRADCMAGGIGSVMGLSSLAIPSMTASTSARCMLGGISAETVRGNCSSTVLLMKRGEPSHQARARAGMARTTRTATATRRRLVAKSDCRMLTMGLPYGGMGSASAGYMGYEGAFVGCLVVHLHLPMLSRGLHDAEQDLQGRLVPAGVVERHGSVGDRWRGGAPGPRCWCSEG